MAQEQFAGSEYHVSFDPEKFIRDLKAQDEADNDENESATEQDSQAE